MTGGDPLLDRCHIGDCIETMRGMPAGIVHTCVTSPPYYALRDYGMDGQIGLEATPAEFITRLVDVFREVRRLLRDDGTCWVNIGDAYAGSWGAQSREHAGKHAPNVSAMSANQVIAAQRKASGTGSIPPGTNWKPKDLMGMPWRLAFALQEDGWWLRQDIIWAKPNPMPESIRDRCTKAHEYIFLLSKSERYYYDFDAMQEPVNGTAHARRPTIKMPDGWATHEGGNGSFHKDGREKGKTNGAQRTADDPQPGTGRRGRKLADAGSGTKNNDSMDAALAVMPCTRNRRSVWTVASEPYSGAHFATFPTKLIEPCILAGAPAGGVVLDPFFGSGTTGQVAQALGRRFIGCELNPAYTPLHDERLRQGSLLLETAA